MNRKTSTLVFFYFLFASILFTSCSSKVVQVNSSSNLVIFPPAPDTTRIQFLTKISNSADVAGQQTNFSKFILGSLPENPITKPYGIAIKKGKIYVCDAFVKGLEIINLENKTMEYFTPSGKGALKTPINCFVDDKEYLYVADAERMQIVVFDNNKEYVTSFGDASNFKPTDVTVFDNKIWVVNLANHKIQVYSNDLENKLLYTFPQAESGSIDYLYSPTNLSVTTNKVYVSDIGDSKIKQYSLKGDFLDTLGSYGKNIGQFARPKGIAIDRDDNLFVVDAAFENVQIFNKNKNLLMYFGGNYTGPGYMWLPAKVVIDYDNLHYFQKYVDPSFNLKYVILVTNQYGPDKISIYGYVEPKK